jgi:hypothetical protein
MMLSRVRPETLFLSRLERVMVSIDLAPQGDGSRSVCVWTWDGPVPVQHRPFVVPSLEDAQDLVPAGALRVRGEEAESFAEEVWLYAAQAVPEEVPAFETEPTVVLRDPELPRARS